MTVIAQNGSDSTNYKLTVSRLETPEFVYTQNDVRVKTLTADEGDTLEYKVRLGSRPSGNMTVTLTEHGEDLTLADPPGGTLTFTTTNWETGQTVKFSVAEDDDAEPNTASTAIHTDDATPANVDSVAVVVSSDDDKDNIDASITHRALGGGYDTVTIGNLDVRVMDDDTAQVIIQKTEVKIAGAGSGNSFQYYISLTQEPSADETVTIRPIFSSEDFTTGTASVELNSGKLG